MLRLRIVIALLWFTAISVPLSFLMGFHSFAFRAKPMAVLAQSDRFAPARGQWQAIHLLNAHCGCSRRVARYLAGRDSSAETAETVLILGGKIENQDQLGKRGYRLIEMTADQAAQELGIENVPELVVLDPGLAVRYAGGYGERRGPPYRDLEILHSLKSGAQVATLPLFGCANGSKMTASIDPLGVKYRD